MALKKIPLKFILKGFSTPADLNRALLFLLFVCFLFLLYDIKTFFMPRMAGMGSDSGYGGYLLRPSAAKQKPPAEPKPLEYYLRQADRKLFKAAYVEKTAGAPAAEQKAAAQSAQELAKKFVLKGVVEGQPPQAVIEDTKSGKSYFVTPGDKIEDFSVEQITGGKVRLRYNDTVLEMTL